MLNTETKKRNSEKLVFNKEIPVKIASATPFENIEDIILSGDFNSIEKGIFELRSKDEVSKKVELESSIKENQIKNVLKDLKKFPDNPFILNNLGLAYLGNKEEEKALSIFIKVIKLKPDFVPVALNLASLYATKNEYDKTLKIYKDLLINDPNDTRILINLAYVYIKTKKLKEAKEIYKKIIKIDPKSITSRNHLALLDLAENRSREAISELRKCLQLKNDLPAIHNNLGVAYNSIGSYKKAIQSFNIALKIFPYYTSAIFNLSVTLAKKDITASISLLEDYLDRKENLQIKELLARLYLENKQFPKALKNISNVLESAMQIDNNDQEIVRLHNNVGVTYHATRNFAKAEEHYQACIERMDFVNDIILGNIIDLYFDSNNTKNAKDYIDIFLNKFGNKNLYFYYLGKYYLITGELKESGNSLNQFLKINKNFAPAYALLGYIYSEHLLDYKKAILLNEMGHRHLPNEESIINNLAYNYLMNNELTRAEEILNKAKDIKNNIYLDATRGLLNIKKGNIEEGRRLYNLAAQFAGNEETHSLAVQKKYLELARYYLTNGENKKAKNEIDKIFSITKGKNTILAMHAKKLSEGIV